MTATDLIGRLLLIGMATAWIGIVVWASWRPALKWIKAKLPEKMSRAASITIFTAALGAPLLYWAVPVAQAADNSSAPGLTAQLDLASNHFQHHFEAAVERFNTDSSSFQASVEESAASLVISQQKGLQAEPKATKAEATQQMSSEPEDLSQIQSSLDTNSASDNSEPVPYLASWSVTSADGVAEQQQLPLPSDHAPASDDSSSSSIEYYLRRVVQSFGELWDSIVTA